MFANLQKLIATQLNISADKITMESRLLEDLGADSLDFVEMLMTFEEEYGISISDEQAKELKTVGDVVNFIEKSKK